MDKKITTAPTEYIPQHYRKKEKIGLCILSTNTFNYTFMCILVKKENDGYEQG